VLALVPGLKTSQSPQEASHRHWNNIGRSYSASLITQVQKGFQHVLEWNLNILYKQLKKSAQPDQFLSSAHGSYFLSIVDATNAIVEARGGPARPLYANIVSEERFGVYDYTELAGSTELQDSRINEDDVDKEDLCLETGAHEEGTVEWQQEVCRQSGIEVDVHALSEG